MLKTIPESFYESLQKRADKTALMYKKDGVYFPITYKELSDKVEAFASGLRELGVKKGDRVTILSENRPEWVISDLAIMTLGAIVVPLHSTFSTKALHTVLNHSESSVLIVSDLNFLDKVLLEKGDLKYLKNIIVIEELSASQKETLNETVISFSKLMESNSDNSSKVTANEDDVCSIIYTSGTTGEPKGVLLTHKNILSNVEAINKVVPVKEGDVFLSFLPLSHIFERTIGYYTPLFLGGTIAYAEGTKELPRNLREVRPTILISVPRIFEKFQDAIWDSINNSSSLQKSIFKWALRQKKASFGHKLAGLIVFRKIKGRLGGRLRLAVSGGASLNENIGRFFSRLGITILEGYGLTETSPVIAANRENDLKFGTVGKLIPGVEVLIADGKEIMVKGPNVTQGYFKNQEETNRVLKEGWFHTGDLGFIDKEGFLTIVGRGKEMIVTSGGKNVWPEPIENLLNDDPFIAQSVVIGNKRKFISALIVPDWKEVEKYMKENNLPLEERSKLVKESFIIDLFNKRINEKINPDLSDVDKIKKFALLIEDFSQDNDEMTPTLKLRRHVIDKRYEKAIESIYS